MSDYCRRAHKDRKLVRKILGSGMGVPSAPVFRKKVRNVEYLFEQKKLELAKKLPVYTFDEIRKLKSPHWALVIDTLLDNDYRWVVDELSIIVKKQEKKMLDCSQYSTVPIKFQKEEFTKLAETLKFCADLENSGRMEHSITLRKDYAVNKLNEGELWLAKHLLLVALRQALPLKYIPRLLAEIHCLMGFIGTLGCGSREVTLEEAISHLIKCRKVSQDEIWHFRPNVLTISIKRPVHLVGLRNDVTTIDGCSLPLYLVACLLEHQLLVQMVNKVLFSSGAPTHDEVSLAIQYANDALQLAFDVRQPEALCSALIRFGSMLRDTGHYEEAVEYFDQVQTQSELRSDKETEALAFYGLATCFLARHEPIHALEMFVVQKEKAENIADVGAEAMQGIGNTLMSEGQTLEAKECFHASLRDFDWSAKVLGTPERWTDETWALDGLSRGQDLWGRFAGLARQKLPSDLRALIKYKNAREALPIVGRPSYEVSRVRRMDKFEGGEGFQFNESDVGDAMNAYLLLSTNYGLAPEKEEQGEDAEEEDRKEFMMDPNILNARITELNKQPWMPTTFASRSTSAKAFVWKIPATRRTLEGEESLEEAATASAEVDIEDVQESDSVDLFDIDIRYDSDRDYEKMIIESTASSNRESVYSIQRHSRVSLAEPGRNRISSTLQVRPSMAVVDME